MQKHSFALFLVPLSLSLSVSALADDLDDRGTAHAHSHDPNLPRVDPNSPAAVFGAQRQIAISSDAGLSISHTTLSGVDGSTTTITLLPAIDYFVIDNLSVGGSLGLDYAHNPDDSHSTTFKIGPRVGYNVPLSRLVSIWPKVGFSFTSTSTSVGGGDSESNNALALNLFVPFMIHPAEHFFLGFGPALDTDLSGDNKATTIAGRLTIGGWI
jgi:hypothetical protein